MLAQSIDTEQQKVINAVVLDETVWSAFDAVLNEMQERSVRECLDENVTRDKANVARGMNKILKRLRNWPTECKNISDQMSRELSGS